MKKSNKLPIIIGLAAILAVTGTVIAVNNTNKTVDETPDDRNNTETITIPDNLVVFNKCRVLKMADYYYELKQDKKANRNKLDNFNVHDAVFDKTADCFEERSKNVASYTSSVNTAWNTRKDEYYVSNATLEDELKWLNNKYADNITISARRDEELENVAMYYAEWGTLGTFDPSIRHFMTYKYANDLIYEAGAVYTTSNNGFTLTITLPSSGKEIVVTQDTDTEDVLTPRDYYDKWYGDWWKETR